MDEASNKQNEKEKSSENYFDLLETCKLQFRDLEDLKLISAFITDVFPGQPNIASGVHALALNAIEHGNLEIGYQFKAELLAENLWQQEIDKRLNMDGLKDRVADIVLTRKDGGTYIIISDQGQGFNWQSFLTIDPGRAGQKHGRGIALAKNLSFERLSYNEVGNQAVAFVPDQSNFRW